VVARDRPGGRRDARDPAVAQRDALDRAVEAHVDARAAQVGDPGVDPRVVGRRVEHPVGPPAGLREVEQQLGEDEAAGAGADLARPRRHQRPGETLGEELAERLRAPLGADVVPPGLELPLLVAALVAAREQRQQALHQHGVLVRRDAEPGHDVEQEAREDGEVLERLGEVRAGDQLVAPAGLGQEDPRRAREPLEDAVAAERDPLHRVRQVAVEAGEEPEAVLGRQVAPATGPGSGHGQAAGLAAGDRPRLQDRDREAALGELVRGAQPGDAAAEDDDVLRARAARTSRRRRAHRAG
jgi:hypothetical protein